MNLATTSPSRQAAPDTDPVLAALTRIERRLAEVERVTTALAPLADLIGAAPGGVAMMTDTVDTLAAKLQGDGVDLDERLRSAVRALEVATAPRAVHGLATLVESQMLEPSALAVISQLAAALAEPGETRPVGVWGAMRALRDADVQRALGFLLAVARTFGRHLGDGELDACRDHLLTASATAGVLEAP
jgi:hypothetical protein